MELFELLQRGYFPKELPPAFNTYKFALRAPIVLSGLNDIIKYPENYLPKKPDESKKEYRLRKDELKKRYANMASSPACYSIEKNDVSRRVLHILNPLNYLKLADLIIQNKSDIFSNIPSSTYSNSKASYASDISKRCIVPESIPFSIFQQNKLKASMSKRYEVRLDVANFYPTIYTHSISWAFLGKDKAKQIWGMDKSKRKSHFLDSDIKLYDLGDDIDRLLRNCNECQTHGIPVGPDVSFLIGELIMSRIDASMMNKYPTGFRYYDDYTFYVDREEDANEIYQTLQAELRHYGLEINEAKFIIRKSPYAINEEYKRDINTVRMSDSKTGMREELLRLFDLMWKCAELKPEKTHTIFKYGLQFLINQHIGLKEDNKGIYEALLYKTAVIKPSLLPQVCKILDISPTKPTVDLLKEMVYAILLNHVPYAQDNEVAWALWICKKYGIMIEKDMTLRIIDMRSTICSIILFDVLHSKQPEILADVEVKSRIDKIRKSWNESSLYGEDWLLMYESSEQGWIPKDDIIIADPFFKILHDNQIKFYDSNIAADYTSYDYIETLQYDYYPPKTRKEAIELKDRIINRIKDEALKLYDEESDDEISKEEIQDDIETEIDKLDVGSSLLNKLLNLVFRGEDIDEEQFVKDYLEQIELYQGY